MNGYVSTALTQKNGAFIYTNITNCTQWFGGVKSAAIRDGIAIISARKRESLKQISLAAHGASKLCRVGMGRLAKVGLKKRQH